MNRHYSISDAIGGLALVLCIWTLAMFFAIFSVGLPILLLAKLIKWVLL